MNQAEQCHTAFRTATKTVAIPKLVKQMGGNLYDEEPWEDMRFYRFPDNSIIATKARGRAHQVWTYMPVGY